MKIVDNRDNGKLIDFNALASWDIFELPDTNELYIKIDRDIFDIFDFIGKTKMVNAIRLDYPMEGFKYVSPNTQVRPLDVEIHINGVKKF